MVRLVTDTVADNSLTVSISNERFGRKYTRSEEGELVRAGTVDSEIHA